jgi:hypothetical protein
MMQKTKKNRMRKDSRTRPALPASSRNEHTPYILAMSHAPGIDEPTGPGQLLPAIFFSSFVILIVRMHTYTRPMSRFFWTPQTDSSSIPDFFSYYKMLAIFLCAMAVLILLLYRITTQSFAIRRSFAYLPMAVYVLCVTASYQFSDYKAFALLGWNDRFEGTLVLLCYMLLLFYIINSVRTEKHVKLFLRPLAAAGGLLSLLGLSQALDKDFFRTALGQKLLVPNTTGPSGVTLWESIDAAAQQGEPFLKFTFQNRQIYQTVYNINYVSFYLTLLIPLFGMLFIRAWNRKKEESAAVKLGLGILFALLIYNLIGSASSGGFFGLGVIGLTGLILLNKKLLEWARPLFILFVITGLVAGVTSDRWTPELQGAFRSVTGATALEEPADPETLTQAEAGTVKPVINYFETEPERIALSLNGHPLSIAPQRSPEGQLTGFTVLDDKNLPVSLTELPAEQGASPSRYALDDVRYRPYLTVSMGPVVDTSAIGAYAISLHTPGVTWDFIVSAEDILYRNRMGRLVDLYPVEHIGFENNPDFGSWRGYIWSRSFPLLKQTILLGTGADTYCAAFPQEDYAGKYSTGAQYDIVVDKPHNLYLGAAIGTGVVSLLALLSLFGIYLFTSARLYRKAAFGDDFLTFAGSGIFFGITGFLAAALVNDSSVSVMPMFYGLLGLGIVINDMLAKRS